MHQKKILYFEDETILAEMYKAKLEQAGFVVVWYQNPSTDPVSLVQKEEPDLILMDILMPVMDGYTATYLIRTNTKTSNIPIVGISNLGQPEDIERAKAAGIDDYLITSGNTPAELVTHLGLFFEGMADLAFTVHMPTWKPAKSFFLTKPATAKFRTSSQNSNLESMLKPLRVHFTLRNAIFLCVVALALGLFYWFEYRPAHIRSICSTQSVKLFSQVPLWQQTEAQYQTNYSICLHNQGL